MEYDINQVPEKLYKKFALLQHFKSYLETDEESPCELSAEDNEINYVKK